MHKAWCKQRRRGSPKLIESEEGPYDKCKDYELHGSGKDRAKGLQVAGFEV